MNHLRLGHKNLTKFVVNPSVHLLGRLGFPKFCESGAIGMFSADPVGLVTTEAGTVVGRTDNGAQLGYVGVSERVVSLAHRMLAGAGRANVVAYRLEGQPTLPCLAHGFMPNGRMVMAAAPHPDVAALTPAGQTVDVRVDIAKFAPDPSVRIVAASAHFLAGLEWLTPGETDELLMTGELPELVAAVADTASGRLAIVSTARVVVHDGSGATPLSVDQVRAFGRELGDSIAAVNTEAVALDAAVSVDPIDLAGMCDAAENGWIPAHLLTRKPSSGGCAHTRNRDFVVDVDLTGVTVLREGSTATSVYFVPFHRPTSSAQDLADNLASLLGTPAAA